MKNNKLVHILFHKDSILLLAILFLLWLTISLVVDEHYLMGDLQKHTGRYVDAQIIITRIKNKPLFKDTTREVQLRLHNYPWYFTASPLDQNLNDIVRELSPDDALSIYTKNKKLGVFGWGSAFRVAHMVNEETGKVVIDYNKARKRAARMKYMSGLAAVIFTIWYIYKVRHRLYPYL